MSLVEKVADHIVAVIGQGRGKLHAALCYLLDRDQGHLGQICREYQISESMDDEGDQKLLLGLFETKYQPAPRTADLFRTGEPVRYAKWVARGAFMLSGIPNVNTPYPEAVPVEPTPVGPVILALIGRARDFADLMPRELSVDVVVRLLDQVVYFRCTRPEDADDMERRLGLLPVPAAVSGDPDVYLRLDVEPGDGVLEAQTLFALKSRLRDDERPRRVTLTKRSLLPPTAALTGFNRV